METLIIRIIQIPNPQAAGSNPAGRTRKPKYDGPFEAPFFYQKRSATNLVPLMVPLRRLVPLSNIEQSCQRFRCLLVCPLEVMRISIRGGRYFGVPHEATYH